VTPDTSLFEILDVAPAIIVVPNAHSLDF